MLSRPGLKTAEKERRKLAPAINPLPLIENFGGFFYFSKY
jgi:hypothetical protein